MRSTFYAVQAVCCGVVGAALILAVLRGISLEAIGGILAGVGTLVLAYFTAQSVRKTSEMAANENANHRVGLTFDLMKQYILTPVPVTNVVSLTAQTAHSQLVMFSKKVGELRELKARYNPSGSEGNDEQYRAIVASFSILLNFYSNAMQLLRQELLDTRLFMNTFAKTFLASFEAMLIVNAEIEAVDASRIELRRDFKEMSEMWVTSRQGSKE